MTCPLLLTGGVAMEWEGTGNWSLEQKEAKSLEVLGEALGRYQNHIATTFTGGKDSLTVLHLLKRLGEGSVHIPVLNLDTTVKFREAIQFRDRIASEWHLNLIVATNYEGLAQTRIAEDPEQCCMVLKVKAIEMA